MHSSSDEEEEGSRHPINAVLQAAKARQLATQAAKHAAAPAQAQEEPQQQDETSGGDQDASDSAVTDPSQPSLASSKKPKRKKPKKRQQQASMALADTDAGIDMEPGPGNQQSDEEEVIISTEPPPRPATAPPDLATLAASAGKTTYGQPKVVFVENQSDIIQSVQLRMLTKAPRYFDEDVGMPEVSSKRCFHCGQMGHNAANCTNEARLKPCTLCAQFGHLSHTCPNRLCFKCGKSGHVSKDCAGGRVEGWESALGLCNRCGSSDGKKCPCVGKGDYYRYEGGCQGQYSKDDLKWCRCYVCGKSGHLLCKKPPVRPAFHTSCYYCGRQDHLGEECPYEDRAHLKAERMGDTLKAMRERELDMDGRVAYYQNDLRRGGSGHDMSRSQSVGALSRQHHRWDDDDEPPPTARYKNRDNMGAYTGGGGGGGRYTSAPRDELMGQRDSTGMLSYGQQNSRYPQHNQQQQQYNGGQQQYGGQYNQQYGRAPYAMQAPLQLGRSQSAGYQQNQYNHQQQQPQVHRYPTAGAGGQYGAGSGGGGQQQWQQQGGGEYGRVRQANTQQQQQARRENDYMRSRWGQGGGGGAGQKRSRYQDDDDDDDDYEDDNRHNYQRNNRRRY